MKKKLISILAAFSSLFLFGACSAVKDAIGKLPFFPDASTEESSDSSSVHDCLEVLLNAYALKEGEVLPSQTLTGKVTQIHKVSEGDVCLTLVACDCEQHPIYCYWLQDADSVGVGDTITVTGDIKNFEGLIEFVKPTLVTENNSGNTGDNGGNTGENGNTNTPSTDGALEILQSAYALTDGATLPSQTLTGKITNIEKTGEGDVCLTLVVGNYTNYPIYCYWLQDADFVKVGDVITVTGDIKNYQGTIEFFKPTLVENGNSGNGNGSGNVDTSEALSVLQSAYALASGATLPSQTLTGKITNIEKTGEGDVCLTLVVGNYTNYPLYCYWLQDADFVKVGDVITVTGDIMNYQGTIEFFKPTLVSGGNSSGNSGGNSGGSSGGSATHTYTAFTASDKNLFNEYFGEAIPFIPNSEYYLEEYTFDYEDGTMEVGLTFYTVGNTQAEFNAYLDLFYDAYDYAGEEEDEYGDTWYFFDSENYYVDLSYYYNEGEYYVDVYVYVCEDSSGGNSGSQTDVELITNEGKGLPSGTNGVYNVDFTQATYVKNVTEQLSYIDGCPTVGSPAVLVVPVEFSDVTAASKGYSIDTIKKAFVGEAEETDYYSVHDYYYASSYGKLDLDITVLDSWFRPKYASSYYEEATMDYYGNEIFSGDQLIIDELLASLEGTMDLSKFDSDGNTAIDAIVLINTLDINSESDFHWAYRYWNLYADENEQYYEYDGVSANDYLWAPYSFLHESYDEDGNVTYSDTSVLNTYTVIHEFGHVLGADDYYDTSYSSDIEDMPMGGCDIMDGMTGDHNAFTKFNYGWLTSSRLVVAGDSVTLTLEDFSKNGDTIILANNWDPTLGAYQEYYILAYYTMTGLNGEGYGYFSRDGIVVYHVNASLYAEEYANETYYDIYNNNTDASDTDGTEDNLIEYVKSANDTFTYVEGDTMSSVKDDQGNSLAYNFVVNSFANGVATITFTKK